MFFKNNKINVVIMFLAAFIIPIIFIYVLRVYYYILPGEEIGEVGDWISFSGGYVGALLALFGIWSQIIVGKRKDEAEKIEKDIGFLKYLVFIINNNINNLENDYYFYKNIFFINNYEENNYDENLFPKNIIEDYFNTLFKYEWSTLFFSINKNIEKFNLLLIYIKTNKNMNNNLFNEFKIMIEKDAEEEEEISKRGQYTLGNMIYLYDQIDLIDHIHSCINHINLKNRIEKLDYIFNKIESLDSSFDGEYTLFKRNTFDVEYSRIVLYKTNDINVIKIELSMIYLFVIRNVIGESFIYYKYFSKFKELDTFINSQIDFIKVLMYLKSNLPTLKENIENEYK